MLKNMLTTILIIIIVFSGLLIYLGLNQDRMIFFPEKLPQGHIYRFPFSFEECSFETEPGILINAIHAKCESPKGLVFYMHGNAGNLDSWADISSSFLAFNYDVFIYDYRGYGKSTGRVTSQSELIHDAEFLLKQVQSQYKKDSTIIYGRSLGTGVATVLAKKHPGIKALILETPYLSFIKLVKNYYFFVPSILIKYKFRTEENLGHIQCPVSIIHGTSDEVIPFNHSKKLKKQYNKITLYEVDGGHHNDLDKHPKFQVMLRDVLGPRK